MSLRDLAPAKARLTTLLQDAGGRSVAIAGLSVPGNLAMAVWKLALLLAAPSYFLLANGVWNIGVAMAKLAAVRSYRRGGAEDVMPRKRRACRAMGAIVVACCLGFVASCVPMLLGTRGAERFDQPVAIAIATVAFVELGVSVRGIIASRHQDDPLIGAIRLTNLAGALILLVFTQAALMSFAYEGDATVFNGLCGVILGTLAALIGVWMLVRATLWQGADERARRARRSRRHYCRRSSRIAPEGRFALERRR